MEQAGLHKLDLYECKDLTLHYNGSLEIDTITTTGAEDNYDSVNSELYFSYQTEKGFNRQNVYDYELKLWLFNLDLSNDDIIEKYANTIYGFAPKLEFFNRNKFFVNEPFFFYDSVEFNTNESHTYLITLKPKILTRQKLQTVAALEITEGIGVWEIENDFIVQ